MERRLGSFTTGGTTDGDIRISERIRNWPAYVVDYILAHEMCHRKYPNHSEEFWAYLSQYPYVERALGFLEGIAHTEGTDPDTMLE
jgi:predicted metal-dependent hydrolase